MLIDDLPEFWRPETDQENITWLYLDPPDTEENRLNLAALKELDAILGEIRVEKPKGVVLLSDKPAGFCAGFDLDQLAGLGEENAALAFYRTGYRVMDKLAALPMPTVVVLQGETTLAGLELALACDMWIGLHGRFDNCELDLGLVPGFGGMGRCFRRLGSKSLDLLLSGRPWGYNEPPMADMFDRLLDNEEQVVPAVRRMISHPRQETSPAIRKRWQHAGWIRCLQAALWRRRLRKNWPPAICPAPYKLLELWQKDGAAAQPFVVGEIRHAARLLAGETAQNLIHAALLRRDYLRSVSKSVKKPYPQQLLVAGVNQANMAVAWRALGHGMRVTLHDADAYRLKQAVTLTRKRLRGGRFRWRWPGTLPTGVGVDREGKTLPYADVILAHARALQWPLLSANKADRQTMLVNCGYACHAAQTGKPGKALVIHAMNLSAKQPLLELATGWKSSSKSVRVARAFALGLGCLPVSVRPDGGFLTGPVLAAVIDEALILVAEGVPAGLIDRIAREHGMLNGPVEYARGLDAAELRAILPAPYRLGVLSQANSFLPVAVMRKRMPEEQQQELFERLLLRLTDAAVECVYSRRVKNWQTLDAALLGSGLVADSSGGVRRIIKRQGAAVLVQRLESLAQKHGARFKPSRGWGKFVAR